MSIVDLRFYLPAPPLRPLITSYYIVEHRDPAAGPIADLLHPEWGNIRFVLRGRWTTTTHDAEIDPTDDPAMQSLLYGPTSRTAKIVGDSGMVMGAGLTPLGWARLIDRPAAELADRIEPLALHFGARADRLLADLRAAPDDGVIVAVLDAFFTAKSDVVAAPLPIVERVHALLMSDDLSSVSEFAATLGLSQRQLERVCDRYFGFSPKLLLRRQRFLRTLAVMQADLDRRWADMLDPQYYDQSHFVRDFRRFMGLSPTQYFALPRQMIEKAAIGRNALLGRSLQGLHPAR
jgi:AraC-like DNA-binding protein